MKFAMLAVLALVIASPSASLYPAVPQHRDVPAEVENAKRALMNAQKELQHAGDEWGGHRVEAMKHIESALKELEEAEKYAREHHQMK
jgi:hypothetical protein